LLADEQQTEIDPNLIILKFGSTVKVSWQQDSKDQIKKPISYAFEALTYKKDLKTFAMSNLYG